MINKTYPRIENNPNVSEFAHHFPIIRDRDFRADVAVGSYKALVSPSVTYTPPKPQEKEEERWKEIERPKSQTHPV